MIIKEKNIKDNVHIDFDKFPMKSKLEVYYTSCKACENFSDNFIKLLKGLLKLTKKEEVIIDVYRSIHCWLKSVSALNNSIHFQALASAARSVFEHLLDIKLIVDNRIDNAIEKFEAFREIEKFRMANDFLEFKRKYPNIETRPHQKRLEVASSEEIKVKIDKLKLLWIKPNTLLHWSGERVRKRTELAGIDYEKLYYESHTFLSWYIHAGQVGTRQMSKEGLELIYADSMRLIHEMFIDAVLLVAKELKLDIAIPAFKDLIKGLERMPDFAILEIEKQYLKESKKLGNPGTQ